MIYAITEEKFMSVRKQFADMMKTNTLPSAEPIVRYSREENVEKTPLEKVQDLFGKENVDVVGGE